MHIYARTSGPFIPPFMEDLLPSTPKGPVWIIVFLLNTPVKNTGLNPSFCFRPGIAQWLVRYTCKLNSSV